MPHGSPATRETPGLLPGSGCDCQPRLEKENGMKVEIFCFSRCPNHVQAVERVREALAQEGITAEMVEVEVTYAATAEKVGFLGSPSIRLDWQDVEPAARVVRAF